MSAASAVTRVKFDSAIHRPPSTAAAAATVRAVLPVEPVPQRLDQVVLLGPDPARRPERSAGEHRVVVGRAEVAGPGEEPADDALGLAGVLPARGANSRTVSSIRKRVPDAVSATLSSD